MAPSATAQKQPTANITQSLKNLRNYVTGQKDEEVKATSVDLLRLESEYGAHK